MKTNKLDNIVKNKFENRTFEPSASAWERLSVQLNEQPKQKKMGWFFYIGAAASILLLVTIGIQMFNNDTQKVFPKKEIVISPIDTIVFDKKINELVNEIPLEKALVKEEIEIKEQKNFRIQVVAKKEGNHTIDNALIPILKEKTIVAKVEGKLNFNTANNNNNIQQSKEKELEILKQDPNSTIKINANDLLYAVTHSPKEVKEYYAKYNVNRQDVIKTIQNELKKSNIKINPNTILAEVERNIDDDDFQNNFMKSLKKRVSNIATAIASRNH